jgi:hypothetical protein
MALKGRLTSAMLNNTLYMRKFSGVPNVTGREIHLCRMTGTKPTPKNGRDNWSFDIGIYNFFKAAKLIRFSATPSSIRMWYSLTLMMVGERSSRSCPTPTMLLGQSEVMKLINVSIDLWCGAALVAGAATTTSRRRFLTMQREVMSQEPLNII